MSNDCNHLPDPATVRERFHTRWSRGFDQSYPDLQIMHLNLLRDYLLLRAVVDELGFHGCMATDFYTILSKARTRLLGTISNKRVRDLLYQKHIDQVGDPFEVLRIVSNAHQRRTLTTNYYL